MARLRPGRGTPPSAAPGRASRAGVWGAASIIPRLCADLYDAIAVRGDLAAGRELWARIFPICKFLESHNYCTGIKTGLDLVGVSAGPTRRPGLPLAPEHRAEFRDLLIAAGVAVVDGTVAA